MPPIPVTTSKLRAHRTPRGDAILSFWCPGCERLHSACVESPLGESQQTAIWVWNMSLLRPTLNPSLLSQWTEGENNEPHRCHLFLELGMLRFLEDCTHPLANQLVKLPPLPEEFRT